MSQENSEAEPGSSEKTGSVRRNPNPKRVIQRLQIPKHEIPRHKIERKQIPRPGIPNQKVERSGQSTADLIRGLVDRNPSVKPANDRIRDLIKELEELIDE
jgi:hypothetical protein